MNPLKLFLIFLGIWAIGAGQVFAQNERAKIIKNLKALTQNKKIIKKIADTIPEGDPNEDCDSVSVGSFSTDIASVVIVLESTLGASGSTNFATFTFNTKTGAIYSLSDMFKPGTDWAHLIWPYVKKALISEGMNADDDNERGPEGYKKFSIDHKNLYLHFDFCELLPCAKARTYTIPIPLEDLRAYLKPMFLPKR